MSDPVTFPSETRNFSLPLLFPGQAQKEFFLNQAASIIDAALASVVEASLNDPPTSPAEAASYLVLAPATGVWEGQEDKIAMFVGESWHFITPVEGISVFDRAASQVLRYLSGWQNATEPSPLQGGAVIDVEARQMLSDIVEALRKVGVFGQS